jgi:hypothetical protein
VDTSEKKNSTIIHAIKGLNNVFAEYKDIKCKGESPSLEEGRRALLRGRLPNPQNSHSAKKVDSTYFEDDEYLLNVPNNVCEHSFGRSLQSNAAMWITSRSGICIYAYKNDRDSLMLWTSGTSREVKKGYARCKLSIIIMQIEGDNHKKSAMLHRVMMMAFSPIFDPEQWVLWEVDHIDQNPKNNDISNLRWVLRLTNIENFIGKNRMTMNKKKKSIG